MSDENRPTGSTLATITAVLAIVSTGLGIWNNHANGRINARSVETSDRIKTMEFELKRQQEERANTGARSDIVMKVYTEVEDATKAAPGEAGERQQKAVIALVSALLKHDPKLQSDLLEALAERSLPSVKSTATESLFVAQETVSNERQAELNTRPAQATSMTAIPTPAKLGHYDFDVFWCEASGPQAEMGAQAIGAALTSRGAQGRVRIRVLPANRNEDPGYQHNGFVIRYNAPEEQDMSRMLKEIADEALQSVYDREMTFRARESAQKTRWYLSAFVCPGAWPHA